MQSKEQCKRYFTLGLHVFFPQNNFFITIDFLIFFPTCYEKLLEFPQ